MAYEKDVLKSQGVVTSRKCPLCGHHEIGITTGDGEFRALVPGMLVRILETQEAQPPLMRGKESTSDASSMTMSEEPLRSLWVPEEIRGHRELCLKYAVWVEADHLRGKMGPRVYRDAYLLKLQRLIDKESDTPLPVILDRLFSAPYLSSGDSRQIAEAMWRELDEVRKPVDLMMEYLERRDEESLRAMIYPKRPEELSSAEPMSDEQIARELEALTLEEFLSLLVMAA
ncbi:MAG: hypothetical protein JRH06_09495 [Deltaproteobacteria bacterium]|nr:hypothetical protein [Deltaproteobacteria bacterium]